MSSANDVLLILFQATYVFCLCYAIVSDFTKLLIPNWIPVLLVVAFALFALMYLTGDGVLRHLMLAGVVFCLGFAFFAAGWIGGGDVKLLTAITLWMGSEAAFGFVLVMAVLGAALALGLLTIKKYSNVFRYWAPRSRVLGRLVDLAESGLCPYGVAIGVAGLIPSTKAVWLFGAAA
jgi:prepilin peptidase CpaA